MSRRDDREEGAPPDGVDGASSVLDAPHAALAPPSWGTWPRPRALPSGGTGTMFVVSLPVAPEKSGPV